MRPGIIVTGILDSDDAAAGAMAEALCTPGSPGESIILSSVGRIAQFGFGVITAGPAFAFVGPDSNDPDAEVASSDLLERMGIPVCDTALIADALSRGAVFFGVVVGLMEEERAIEFLHRHGASEIASFACDLDDACAMEMSAEEPIPRIFSRPLGEPIYQQAPSRPRSGGASRRFFGDF